MTIVAVILLCAAVAVAAYLLGFVTGATTVLANRRPQEHNQQTGRGDE